MIEKLTRGLRTKFSLFEFLINAACLAYTFATRFTNFLFASKPDKIIIFTGCLMLSITVSALFYLVIFRSVFKSITSKTFFRVLTISLLITILLFLALYEPPPFPEQHNLVVTTLGDHNPLSNNARVEVVSVSTISYPLMENRRIPITQFEYDGVWRGINDSDFGLYVENNREVSFRIDRFMQAGIEIQFQSSPGGGFVKVNWDGEESTIDLYSEKTKIVTHVFEPNLNWRKADTVRKILVAGAILSDFFVTVSILLVFILALIQLMGKGKEFQIRSLSLFTACVALTTIMLVIVQQVNKPVSFDNPQIESGVRQALNRPEGNIYQRQLLSIVDLDLSNKKISDLHGIEQLSNLIELDLQNNQIRDISNLANLAKLKKLNLKNNLIIDIGPLISLENLEYLNIYSNTTITSIKPIESLGNLRTLILGNVPVGNRPINLSNLERIHYLNLRNCGIKDVDFLSSLTNLVYLNLHSNSKIQTIEPLQNLTNLETLILANMPINDEIVFLSGLDQLKYLNLRNTDLSDISQLSHLVNLEYLNLHSNANIASINHIQNLYKLKHLILQNVPVEEEAYLLAGFDDLRTLNIRNSGIDDFVFLEGMLAKGMLQDNPKLNISASLDIRDNPIPVNQDDSYVGVRPYWQNIASAEPKTLPFYAELDPPEFSNPSGFYNDAFLLSLSNPNANTSVHYTLDGSEPTTRSALFSSPILIEDQSDLSNIISDIESIAADWNKPIFSVQKAIIVRAKVINDNNNASSSTITHTYFIGTDFEKHYSLPVISLVSNFEYFFDDEDGIYVLGKVYEEIKDSDISEDEKQKYANFNQRGKEWERPVHIEMLSIENQLVFSQDGGVRIHGGGSRRNPQKSLRIYADYEYDVNCLFNYPFFGEDFSNQEFSLSPKYGTFLLRNAGQDWMIAMMRDSVSQSILNQTNLDAQSEKAVIVFLNGEYWGIYQLQERYDEYYLQNNYGLDESEASILRQNGELFRGNDTEVQRYIELSNFLRKNNLSKAANYEYVQTQIDIENYTNYLIANIFMGNTDWPNNNIYLWRKSLNVNDQTANYGHDGRWRWMIFDMDFSFGLQGHGEGYKHNTLQHAQMEGWSGELFRSLLENETYQVYFINQFADHMNSTFTPLRTIGFIDEKQALLAPEMEEFFARWGSNKDGLIEGWYAEIEVMRDFAQNRSDYIQQFIMEEFSLSGASTLTLNIDYGKGHLIVNSLEISNDSPGENTVSQWTGTYFNEVPISVTVVPRAGFTFSHWEETGSDEENLILTLSSSLDLTPVFLAD